jgi:hypothetical protein
MIPSKIKEFLRGEFRPVLLRAGEIEETLRRGGDIDIVVENPSRVVGYLKSNCDDVVGVIKRSDRYSVLFRWGKIDLHPDEGWHGASYLNYGEIVQDAARDRDAILRPSVPHEALICWLSSLLWGGFFKEKYKDLIVAAGKKYPDRFQALICSKVGRKLGNRLFAMAAAGEPEESVKLVWSLRARVLFFGFLRSPVFTAKRYFLRWADVIGKHAFPKVPWIAILGPDGSGKSTVIAGLTEPGGRVSRLMAMSCYHWRPNVIFRKKVTDGVVESPHDAVARSAIASAVQLAVLLLDWRLGLLIKINRDRGRLRIPLFDRNFWDIVVDPIRYRNSLSVGALYLFCRLCPQPSMTIVLDSPTHVVQSRKKEVTPEETERQRIAYLSLGGVIKSCYIVNSDRSPKEVVSDVEELMLFELSRSKNSF